MSVHVHFHTYILMGLYKIKPEAAGNTCEKQILPPHCALKKKGEKSPFHLSHGREPCDVGNQSRPLHKAEHFKE